MILCVEKAFFHISYDEVSNLKTATNVHGTVTLNYDARNRVESVTDVWGQAIAYGYDANSNRTALSFPNYAVTYGYDALNRLTQVNHTQVGTATFGYDAVDRLRTRPLPNGINTTADYDDLDRLTALSYSKAGLSLPSFQYSYNAVNQITHQIEAAGTHTFNYDELQRLTSATHPNLPAESYTYDQVGDCMAFPPTSGYPAQAPSRTGQNGVAARPLKEVIAEHSGIKTR